ncbi:MAG: uroporphyrinogen decarboxylase [Candidatus Hydrogenedentes bacterium]|nr:uroporphyrinogen decarboxylase [Candidatus Hydrogenedentota bacterium]
MNARERVMTAFRHREPDRVPVDYLANSEIDRAVKAHFGLEPGDSEGLCKAFGVDFRGCYCGYTGPKLHEAPEGMQVNEWGVHTRWIEHSAGGYWDFCHFPLAGSITVDDVNRFAMPSPDDYDYESMRAYCDAHEDYPIVLGGAGVGCIINRCGQVRGMMDTLCDVTTGDPAGMRLVDRINDTDLETLRRALDSVGNRVQIFCMGEDLGTQKGPIVAPDTFRNVLKPRAQRFIDLAKKYDLLVMFHTCGSSSWAFDELADMGVDIIDTLQPETANMEPAFLKKTFGHKLCFHVMVSTAGVLAFGSAQDVRDEVRRLLDIMMPGGGFALSPTHLIQSNSPVENVVALYETAREFGAY